MWAPTSASLFVLGVGLLACSQAEVLELTVNAHPGEDVTLACHAKKNITTAVWHLKGKDDGYVLFENGKVTENSHQLPSFKGRVELKERWKECGNVSLTLKNVMTTDSGRYECKVKEDGAKSAKLINTVMLTVQPNITVKSGQTVNLPCKATHKNTDVQWVKTDLETQTSSDFSVKTCQLSPENDRMELKEGCKDGDVSLILKNVNTADSGTYECGVKEGGGNRSKRAAAEPISTIRLSVVSADHRGGNKEGGVEDRNRGGPVGLVVGLVVGVALVVAAVGFMIYRRRQMKSSPPPPDEAVKDPLV